MTLLDYNDHENIFEEPSIFKTDDVLPPDLIRVKPKKKSCGSCRSFTKWKNDSIGGGLCEHHDTRTKSDRGSKCDDWRGIKYKRKRKSSWTKSSQNV